MLYYHPEQHMYTAFSREAFLKDTDLCVFCICLAVKVCLRVCPDLLRVVSDRDDCEQVFPGQRRTAKRVLALRHLLLRQEKSHTCSIMAVMFCTCLSGLCRGGTCPSRTA